MTGGRFSASGVESQDDGDGYIHILEAPASETETTLGADDDSNEMT